MRYLLILEVCKRSQDFIRQTVDQKPRKYNTYPLFIDLTDVDKWTTFWQPQMAKWMRFVFLATRKTQKTYFPNYSHLLLWQMAGGERK